MLKVNLENKLLKENEKVDAGELLLVNEYVENTALTDNQILSRLGMTSNLIKGRSIKEKKDATEAEINKYDRNRVFHISQIESICKKYRLKFLNVQYYKGKIDGDLATKISTFEIAHGNRVECNNSFIAAPANSFKLERRPKDPLFFVRIKDDYYYLVHKWGKDLNILRRIFSSLRTRLSVFLTLVIISFIPGLIIMLSGGSSGTYIPLTVFVFVLLVVCGGSLVLGEDFFPGLDERNNWDKNYI